MAKRLIKKVVQFGGVDINRYNKALAKYAELYSKYSTYTMVPKDLFVMNLELCASFLDVEGDVVECGVWRGGMIAALAEIAGSKKHYHLFDSFIGLPKAKEIDGQEAIKWQDDTTSVNYHDNCSADEEFAIEAMRKSGQYNYKIYKGWFENTLSHYKGNPISILRLDGDWYDSTKICLQKLFPLISVGGLIVIDDYYVWDGCSRAVHDYLSETKSSSRIFQWKNHVAYIIKKD